MPGNAGRTVPAIPITTKLPAIIHHNASIGSPPTIMLVPISHEAAVEAAL
jgi:hypothetical protein